MQGVVDPDQQPTEPMPPSKTAARRTLFRWVKPGHPYERKHPLDWAVFILLFLTTVATGFAAYYTHNQWLAAVDTEKRQLRAYLFIDRSDAEIKAGPQFTDLRTMLKNYGQTPATNVLAVGWLGILNWPLPMVTNFNSKLNTLFPTKFILAQGAAAPAHAKTIWPLTEAEIKEVRGAGAKKLVFYGFMTYDDIFGEPHTTRFCMGLMVDVNNPDHAEDCNQHTDAN
jgi:hypothetical protein